MCHVDFKSINYLLDRLPICSALVYQHHTYPFQPVILSGQITIMTCT